MAGAFNRPLESIVIKWNGTALESIIIKCD